LSRPLRVGVVGCGGIAQMMHLPTLAERPDLFTIAALADLRPDALEAVGQRYGVKALHTDPHELLARADVEAVLLLSSGSHQQAALDTLAAGKHLFVEKPVAFSLGETEAVAAAAARAPVVAMVGFHKRFDPAYQRAREAVRCLRDLRLVEVTVLHPDDGAYRAHHAILPWREQRAPSEAEIDGEAAREALEGPVSGAVARMVGASAAATAKIAAWILFDSVVHDVDAVRGILGEPEEVLSAHAWRGGLAQTSLTRFPGDVRALLSWVSLPGLQHYEETLRFVGPEGRITLVFPSPYLRHAPTPLTIERMDGGELVVEHRTVSYEEAFRAELHHFRECVLSGKKPAVGLEDAVASARWIEAIARALAG